MMCMLMIFSACTNHDTKPYRSEITIMIDNTEESGDRSSMLPQDELWKLLNPDTQKHQEGSIHFVHINNVSLNQEKTIEIFAEDDDATRLQKKRAREKFVRSLDSAYKYFLAPSTGTESSTIYRSVCRELNQFNKSNADHKVLIIMSDMIEFSSDGDFYHITPNSVSSVIEKLSKVSTLPNGSKNMEVIILFQPQNEVTDAKFNNAMLVWDKLFADHGISFTVKANL